MQGSARHAAQHAAPRHAPLAAVARPSVEGAAGADCGPVQPAPAPASASAPLRHARLDAVFTQALGAMRAQWLQALATEPAGPARQVRAYVRTLCGQALQPRPRRLLLQVLMQPQYQTVWCDFVAEGCAGDTVDHDLSMQCRAAVEGLWFRQATLHQGMGREPDAPHALRAAQPSAARPPLLSHAEQAATVAAVREHLLALCAAAASTGTAAPVQASQLPAGPTAH